MPALDRVVRDIQFARQSQQELGTLGGQIAQLHKWSLPTPATILIPTFCFDQLLVQSRALRKIHDKLSVIQHLPIEHRRREVQQLIDVVPISQMLINQIKHDYQNYLGGGDAVIIPSDPTLGDGIEQVRGEVSVIISLQRIWAEMILQALTQTSIPTKQKLAPSAVLIQEQSPIVWQGSIYNRHPDALHKSALVIDSKRATDEPHTSTIQTYQIDRRTSTIIARPTVIRNPNLSASRQPDQMDTTLLQNLATDAQQGFRQSFRSLRLDWMYDGKKLRWSKYVVDPVLSRRTTIYRTQKIATRILLAVSSLHRGVTALAHADGVGILDSNYLVNSLGIHPMAALQQSAAREILASNISKALADLTSSPNAPTPKPITYRLYNSLAIERRRLKLALNYEVSGIDQDQSNPNLAFFIRHPSWLTFELEMLNKAFARNPGAYALLIPGITSPNELEATVVQIRQSDLYKTHRPQLWLEASVPAVACNITLFNLDKIHTISFHNTALQQHMLNQSSTVSLDQHELAQASSLRLIDIIDKQLSQLTTAERPQLVLHSSVPDTTLVQQIVERGWYGITTSPAAILSTRSFVMDAERALLFRTT